MNSKLNELFGTISAHQAKQSAEFNEWFTNDWAIKNSLDRLSAPLDKIKKGALIEWEYCRRGATPDNRKYCDVILGEGFGELSNLVVDVKYVGIRSNRDAIFNTVFQRHAAKRSWYESLNINELHFWSHLDDSAVIEPWFRWVVKTCEVIKL